MKHFLFFIIFGVFADLPLSAQQLNALNPNRVVRCATQQSIETAVRKNPGVVEKWRKEGERRLSVLLNSDQFLRGHGADEEIITIPVVFHLVDEQAKLDWITDREIYDQIELLNEGFNGIKADFYKDVIPGGMYNRLGRIRLNFVLARRNPEGKLTTGIERRVNKTPGRIDIKSNATGGLDAWDTEKYLNIWVGTFSAGDEGLLGIATPPFYTDEGPQGVVIGIGVLPYTSNVSRSYYPTYTEGVTLIHEIGHYFYLWHTFGDEYVCNNTDFRLQPGWPLPEGAGPEGDDTPPEKADDKENAHYGNPSENYSDGCSPLQIGMMYGSFMNYFDDRAMFMFSEGLKKRVLGCIQLYRPRLATSNGATPPTAVNDAYVVSATPYGIPERRAFVTNEVPVHVKIRNYGNTILNKITITLKADALPATSRLFSLNLDPGQDTVLFIQNFTGTPGTHLLTVYTSLPNNKADDFPHNDTLQSFLFLTGGTATAPLKENFAGATFPPDGWQIWNPNRNTTWVRNETSGFTTAGSAAMLNHDYSGTGQLDELITPAISMGVADSALLTFKVAYCAPSLTDVSLWDGLEIYISNNKGVDYQLVYKKTGKYLASVKDAQKSAFFAPPGAPEKWKSQTVDLTKYLKSKGPLLIKFRNVTAFGNNLFLDDISITPYVSTDRDVSPYAILQLPELVCGTGTIPSVAFRTNGRQPLKTLKINYLTDDGKLNIQNWSGNLPPSLSDTVELTSLPSLATGRHELTVYTSSPNGLADLNPINDTIRKVFYVPGRQELAASADFENTAFPPAGWLNIENGRPDNWQRTLSASSSGKASMVSQNRKSVSSGTSNKLISPVLTGKSGYDSLFVAFDYAYSPGKPGAGIDTLEIMISRDCGRTMETVWKKWGEDLETVDGDGDVFIPNNENWDSIAINILPFVGDSEFQVFFVARGNGGNDLYIDNINVFGVTVPERLKKQGYLIYPNPFSSDFIIRHYEDPVDLKMVELYNSAGQKVWEKNYYRQAYRKLFVHIPGLPAGVYSLRLVYENHKVVEKIIRN